MKALVIYESMFGNTEKVARAIADGLREKLEVTLADVRTMPGAYGVDLLVIGGPTHAFGMSRPSTREQAAQQGEIRPGAADVGVREYLACSPLLTGMSAAAFDTKVDKPWMPGSASGAAARRLRKLGFDLAVPPTSFLVDGITGPLGEGEVARARRWGEKLAKKLLEHHGAGV
jgi:hypothetical protein